MVKSIFTKLLILLAVLLVFSPVIFILMNNQKMAEGFNGFLVHFFPGFKQGHDKELNNLALNQVEVKIQDNDRGNFFLPGRQYFLQLPAGFSISAFATNLGNVGAMALTDDKQLLVSIRKPGQILKLKDKGDGFAESSVLLDNIADFAAFTYAKGYVYVLSDTGLTRYPYQGGTLDQTKGEMIISGYVHAGAAVASLFVSEDKIFLSYPSSCLLCTTDEGKRARIYSYSLDGKNETLVASGIREVGGIAAADDAKIYFNDNKHAGPFGATGYAEFNALTAGKNYGWPYCHDNQMAYTTVKLPSDNYCTTTEPAFFSYPADAQVLALRYVNDAKLPDYLHGSFLSVQNGSSDTGTPAGYKVVLVNPKATRDIEKIQDFVYGWLLSLDTWGRPVDVLSAGNGTMYIDEDLAGTVYQLKYKP